jgi:hypothetical protein
MRTVSVPSLLIALAVAATAAKLPAEQALLTAPAPSLGCPVDFLLERKSPASGAVSPAQSAAQAPVQRGQNPGAPAAKRAVEVTLRSWDGKVITEATVTVYAPRIGDHTTPARVFYGQTPETEQVTKTYQLAQDKASKGPLTGDLELLDTMAGVTSASIRSVTYADGSKWLPVKGAACVAAPRNYLEVAGR